MEGFKRVSKPPPRRRRGKQKQISGSLLSLNLNHFQQFKQPGEQQNNEKRKKTQKSIHLLTPKSEEKPRKQAKSVLHQEMNMEELIKVELNLQQEVKILRKDNDKLVQQLNLVEEQSQDSCPRKESQATFESYHKVRIANPKISFRNRLGKIEEELFTFKKDQSKIGAIKMKIEVQKERQRGKQLNIKKKYL